MKVPNRSLVPIRGRLGTFSVAPASRAPTSDGQFERAAFDSVKCVASGLRDSWSSDRGRPDSQWTADGGSTVGPSRLLRLVGCRGGQDRVARSGSNGRSYGSASTGDQSAQCGGHTGDVTGCSYFRNRRTPAPGLCDRCHRCRPTRLVVARSWCGRVAPGAHSLDGLARNVPVPGLHRGRHRQAACSGTVAPSDRSALVKADNPTCVTHRRVSGRIQINATSNSPVDGKIYRYQSME